MPIQRMKDIRGMSLQERERRLRDLKAELLRLRTMVEAGGAVENPARIRELKRTISRILTVENEEKKEAKRK